MNRFQMETYLAEARQKERAERDEELLALLRERRTAGEMQIRGLNVEERAKESQMMYS